MAIFISLVTEAFDAEFDKRLAGTSAMTGLKSARRPLRGIELKEETHAYLKVVHADGREVMMLSSSSPTGETAEYSDFLLQSVQDDRMEKHQVVETFGETYIYFFGEAPRYLNVSAILFNTADFQWKHQFMQNYERFLRGTRCVEEGCRAYLFYDQNVIEGYVINARVVETVPDPHVVPLAFQFFVTKASSVALISADYPVPGAATAGVGDLTVPLNGEQIDLLRDPGPATFGNPDDSFVSRQIPLRGKFADNLDEFTAGGATEQENPFAFDNDLAGIESLPASLGSVMQAYGVLEGSAFSPSTMMGLGLGPTFLPGGVGVGFASGRVGSVATFGAAAPSAAVGMGGFAGMRVGAGAQAKLGFSSFASAFGGAGAGVAAGATAGTFAGGSVAGSNLVGPQPFAPAATPYDQAYARVTALQNATSRNPGYGPAYANALALAQFQTNADRYAYAQAAQAARAGGYVGANASLGFFGPNVQIGASHAGASVTTGASVAVGGRPTAFAYMSLPGTLTNANLPPEAVLQAGPGAGFTASWSWPSVA